MAEDPLDPRGVGDDRENAHAVSTSRTEERALAVSEDAAAAHGIDAVDLRDKPGHVEEAQPYSKDIGARGLILALRWLLGKRRKAQKVGTSLPGVPWRQDWWHTA
jgi:hypothetical protein